MIALEKYGGGASFSSAWNFLPISCVYLITAHPLEANHDNSIL